MCNWLASVLMIPIIGFEAETGISMEKIKQCLYNSRVTIALLCIFVGTKLPIAILAYAHYFHMVSCFKNYMIL